jgi:hypothetical protein
VAGGDCSRRRVCSLIKWNGLVYDGIVRILFDALMIYDKYIWSYGL